MLGYTRRKSAFLVIILLFLMIFVLQSSLATNLARTIHIIQDGDVWNGTRAWQQFGPAKNWQYVSNGGYKNTGFRYTYNTKTYGAKLISENYARWVAIGQGHCDWWVYIPAHNKNLETTREARYVLNSGTIWWRSHPFRDQRKLSGKWFDVLEHLDPAFQCYNPSLYLVDSTKEVDGSKTILFDATGAVFNP